MDADDETDSYLRYLNDSETQNTFLLETNEAGIFSEEPIFTEIDPAVWPNENFPLLLASPLITEEQPDDVIQDDFINTKTEVDTTTSSEVDQDSCPEEPVTVTENNTVSQSLLKSPKKPPIFKSVNDLFSTVIANKCKICSYLCENLEQIKSHIAEKHSNFFNGGGVSILFQNQKKDDIEEEIKKEYTVYVCSVCNDVCMNKFALRQHMIEAHNLTMEPSKPKTTEVRNEKSTLYGKSSVINDLTVNILKKQEKTSQIVKCSIRGCNTGFPSEEICKKHELLHCGQHKSIFKCSECEQKFKLWRIARNHMYKDHKVDFGMIKCPMCNTFKSYHAVTILKHMVTHSTERPFLCSECGKSFKQWAQLKNHEVLHRAPEDLPAWSKVKQCGICDRFFSNAKSLKVHINAVHENFKPFICNICGHKTTRKAMLELHLRQHTGAKPFSCEYCLYKTADYNCLRKHALKHVGGFKYQCPHCPYTCIQSGSFKHHLRSKHKGKEGTYSCQHCPFTTINPAHLDAHNKKHVSTNLERPMEPDTQQSNLQADDETQNCFLTTEHVEETVDNGGITIPAGLELPMS